MPYTKSEICQILTSNGLPADMKIDSEPPLGTNAAYYWTEDTLRLGPDAELCTILHEAAHAEHYGKLNLRKNPANPVNHVIGLILASEVYVGQRLAELGECIADIRHRTPGKNFWDVADRLNHERVFFQSFGEPGVFMQTRGFLMLTQLATLLGAELQTGSTEFFGNMRAPFGVASALLETPLKTLRKIAEGHKLEDLTSFEALEQSIRNKAKMFKFDIIRFA